MSCANPVASGQLKQAIKDEASRLGFTLAGFASPDAPDHLSAFEDWLANGLHATMGYMAEAGAQARRADPHLIMADCRSILVLAAPYSNPAMLDRAESRDANAISGRVAAYAWGSDYHVVLPARLKEIVQQIERLVGHGVKSRCYTDTGPILERDLAQRAGLGWIGKNSCLINPRHGSYFLLAEILLDIEIEPDAPFSTDHCGSCRRCIEACPTQCILPNRTLDAGRCISYLTIELRDDIPAGLRSQIGNWIFGCDVCQLVCPWNRFAPTDGDEAFRPRPDVPEPDLRSEMNQTAEEFSRKFRQSAVKRTRRRGYMRNVAVALGNSGKAAALPALQQASQDPDAAVREHVEWAIQRIRNADGTHA